MKKMFKKIRIGYHHFMLAFYHDEYEQARADGDNKEMTRIDKRYKKHLKKLSKLGDSFAKELGF